MPLPFVCKEGEEVEQWFERVMLDAKTSVSNLISLVVGRYGAI